jgi:hypothetical protein
MYSNKKERAFRTPFCTLSSGTRYSFIKATQTIPSETQKEREREREREREEKESYQVIQ